MKYLVIYRCDDDLHTDYVTKAELERRLSANYYGSDITWFNENDLDKNPYKLLNACRVGVIIKGEVIVPKAVEVITKYEV